MSGTNAYFDTTDKPLVINGWRIGNLKPEQIPINFDVACETKQAKFDGIEDYEFDGENKCQVSQ